MVAAFAERRRYIIAALNALPGFRCAMPGGAFYAFPNIAATGFDSRTLQSRLLDEAGVATVSGTSFGAFGDGYLRFSYAAGLAQLEEAMARIGDWLARQQRTVTAATHQRA
jgi:aspartate/methionine/tyrosine aminotransferase